LVAITTGCATAPAPRTSSSSVAENCNTIYAAMDAHTRRMDPTISSCAAGGALCPTQTDLETLSGLTSAATSCLQLGYIPPGNIEQRMRKSERRAANLDRIVRRLEGRS
jgi:hypothetical protein